jgi:hypothetical protein
MVESRGREGVGGMKESDFQRQITDWAKLNGWTIKTERNVRIARPDGSFRYSTACGGDGVGWPDLFLVRDHRAIAAELKAGRNQPTPGQSEWLRLLDNVTVSSHLWRPEDIDDIIKELAR